MKVIKIVVIASVVLCYPDKKILSENIFGVVACGMVPRTIVCDRDPIFL